MPKSPTIPTQYPSPQWARARQRWKPRHSCRGGRPPLSAALGPPPTTPPPPHVWDEQGHIVLLRVRALVPEKVTVRDPAQGTVRATVLAMDAQINQVTIQTQAEQRLILFLDPASFTGLRVGQQFLLQVAQRFAPECCDP
jgi:hypothetical protein